MSLVSGLQDDQGWSDLVVRNESRAGHFRSVFISDVHLGTRAAQTHALLDFLKHVEADTYYLVGDIVDFWKVRRGPAWPQSHNDVLQKLLRKVRKGARIVFIPGNHDEALRDYCGQSFGGIDIRRDTIHERPDGRRYLVMHGDEFDVVVRYAKWLAILGDRSYELALWSNAPLNWIRRHMGLGYWSLSAYLKLRIKTAVNFVGEFENALAEVARRRGVDGVICGHIHHAADRIIEGVHYLNCGDWVESCTAIIEKETGEIEVVCWRASVDEPVVAAEPRCAADADPPEPAQSRFLRAIDDPQWRMSAQHAAGMIAPGGTLHMAHDTVSPRADLELQVRETAARYGHSLEFWRLHGGYAD